MLKNILSSFLTRAAIAFINFAILLMSTRYLGSAVVGQVSLLILNIAVVQIVNEIYTGSSIVFYIPRYSLKKIYKTGFLWAVLSTGLINLIFIAANLGVRALWIHGLILSFTITVHSFHCVIILAKEKFKQYNYLILFQPLFFLFTLVINIFYLKDNTIHSYLMALYVSYSSAAIFSFIVMLRILKNNHQTITTFSSSSVLKNGFVNQLGNLAHTLSNRYNYYLIATSALVGVYASATSLIESVWIIGGSVAPILLSRIANTNNITVNYKLTFLLAKLCFLLSAFCVLVIYLLPESFFTFLLGKDFSHTKNVMLHLSPGILCISFSTVISHYFSGLGRQRVQLLANGLGLLTTIIFSYFLIKKYELIGACYAASLSYFVASMILVTVFMKQNSIKFLSLFDLRSDFHLLRK
jgi:O-antigen/teichoic acid export membrane protein